MSKSTEWQRQTRNRVLRVLLESSNFTDALWKRTKKVREPALVAAHAKAAAEHLRTQARELEACAADLGYGGTDE